MIEQEQEAPLELPSSMDKTSPPNLIYAGASGSFLTGAKSAAQVLI